MTWSGCCRTSYAQRLKWIGSAAVSQRALAGEQAAESKGYRPR